MVCDQIDLPHRFKNHASQTIFRFAQCWSSLAFCFGKHSQQSSYISSKQYIKHSPLQSLFCDFQARRFIYSRITLVLLDNHWVFWFLLSLHRHSHKHKSSPVIFFFTVHTLVGFPGNSDTAISDTYQGEETILIFFICFFLKKHYLENNCKGFFLFKSEIFIGYIKPKNNIDQNTPPNHALRHEVMTLDLFHKLHTIEEYLR